MEGEREAPSVVVVVATSSTRLPSRLGLKEVGERTKVRKIREKETRERTGEGAPLVWETDGVRGAAAWTDSVAE